MILRQILLVSLVLTPFGFGEITLASPFSNGGILQREKPVPVWGRAEIGQEIKVNFGDQTKTTTADASGKWMVTLDAMPASAEGRSLKLNDGEVEISNILVGEVWLASGQSNMQWNIGQLPLEKRVGASEAEIPLMRLFNVPMVVNEKRQETVDAKWTPATPENIHEFSAVGFFFGRLLTEKLKIPVGIIHSSWGGSRIEPWLAEEGFEGIEPLKEYAAQRRLKSPGYPEYEKAYRPYVTQVEAWAKDAAITMDAGFPAPPMPKPPDILKLGYSQEFGTYQAMIHPLAPYSVRGFLWYQGESNLTDALYADKMKALIQGWRKQFKVDSAPFYYVQLAPFTYGNDRKPTDLPKIWAAQQSVMKVPNTGMAVINDIGDLSDIHPTEKLEVARRLFLWACADTYGDKDLVKSGPLFSGFRIEGSKVEIQFDHTGSGLMARDSQPLSWFEIAGADDVFHQAVAEISTDGKSVSLRSPAVANPDRARFAWSQIALPNLVNREGLPAGAFHTHFGK